MEKIKLDDGFAYGLGAFETIAVEDGRPIFLKEHLNRLAAALKTLGIAGDELKEKHITEYLGDLEEGKKIRHSILKIMVSSQNRIFTVRENQYTDQDYKRGFQLKVSPLLRNETSPFTYMKTLNYGECIWEKRKAQQQGIDEPVFLNTRGELCEGAVSNIFFVKGDEIYTPAISCGLLPGIMRGWIIGNVKVKEVRIMPKEVVQYEEMFITNSIMGIMPVAKLGEVSFRSRKKARLLQNYYKKTIKE